jgi:hypothetical protein
MKAKFLAVAMVSLFLIMPFASAATTIPESYSQNAPVGTTLTYNIVQSSGNVTIAFWDMMTFQLLSSTLVDLPKGGKIEVVITGFNAFDTPTLNITFYSKNGQKNASFTDIAMSDIAYTLLLGVGMATAGFLAPNNWTAMKEQVTAIANTPATEMFSMNGSLKINENDKQITFDYKQNLDLGNQNTTITYLKDTGVMSECSTAFGDFFFTIKLDTGTINGYSIFMVLGITAASMLIIIKRRK